MLRIFIHALCALALAPIAVADAGSGLGSPCETRSFGDAVYTACALDLASHELSLHWKSEAGDVIGQPTRLKNILRDQSEDMVLATNGGMYHPDRTPVGLFIEDGEEKRPLVRGEGPGNFQLLPNGVFSIEGGIARVEETEAYFEAERTPDLATQSGPMLVINGELHPAFRQASDSVHRRSGVGVSEGGDVVWIVISEGPVNFHSFASFFRDELGLDNALFLDGKVSRLDVPADDRREFGLAMGPILAATLHTPVGEDEVAATD